MAVGLRDISDDLIHHSDKGSKYLSLTYSERLEEAGITASVARLGIHAIVIYLLVCEGNLSDSNW